MAIKINIEAVEIAASQIRKINCKMENDFEAIDTAMNELMENWDGVAAQTALEKYKSIKNKYNMNRYYVVNDMVNFMKKQIGQNYNVLENTIVSAVSAFK